MNRFKFIKNIARFVNLSKLSSKLFVSVCASILVFTLTVGLLSYHFSKSILQKQAERNSQQTVTELGQKLDYYFRGYETISKQVMIDRNIENSLLFMEKANDKSTFDYETNRVKARDILNAYNVSEPSIIAVHIVGSDGENLNVQDRRFKDGNIADTDWFKSVKENGPIPTWIPTKKEGYSRVTSATIETPSFMIGRQLTGLQSAELLGMLLIEIKAESLNNELAKNEGNGVFYILDKNRNMVFNGQTGEIGIPYHDPGSSHLVVSYPSEATGWTVLMEIPVEVIVKDADSILNITLIVSLFSLIAAAAVGYYIMRMISRPLSAIEACMAEGAKGNLDVRANIVRRDEIGKLGQSFDQMMENMAYVAKQTNGSAQSVMNVARELVNLSEATSSSASAVAAAAQQISAGSTVVTSESEKVSEFTERFGNRLLEYVKANDHLEQSAHRVKNSSDKGSSYLARLAEDTKKAEQVGLSLGGKFVEFQASTESIQKILDVMNQLTKQTNILSLNATIEASRAGSAGKGFMVVADEIRKLAEQSKKSIEVVASILEQIGLSAADIMKEQQHSMELFQAQLDSVTHTDTIFIEVNRDMGSFMDELARVRESLTQFLDAQRTLSESMHNVSAVAEQSLASSIDVASMTIKQKEASDETLAFSRQLDELAKQLSLALSQFRYSEG